MLSYWEKESFINYDFAIIGSGIVGLSTAISLKEKSPKSSVVVLERGILPSGASTKNAGFACFGSLTELCQDIDSMGADKAFELVKSRKEGLEILRSRLGDKSIDYHNFGGFELIRNEDVHYLDRINEVNDVLNSLFEGPVFTEKKDLRQLYGFSAQYIKTTIRNPYEGQIDTGKMMVALLELARLKGIHIITGAEVKEINEGTEYVHISINNTVAQNTIVLKSKHAAICTNGFSQQFLPSKNIKPGRGLVLITRPIPGLKFKGTFHLDKGYFYFRNIYNRVLLGGGRHLHEAEETTTDLGVNPDIQAELEGLLHNVILPGTPFDIDHSWSGIMGFGQDKRPIVDMRSKNIAVGVRLGGMGVALGSHIGEKVADLIV